MLILNASSIPWEKRYKHLVQYRRELKQMLRANPSNEKLTLSLERVEAEIQSHQT